MMFFNGVFSELPLRYGLGLLTCLSLSYIITVVVYRLYFHPLAKFPGPFWARISAFPAYYHTLKKDRHVWLWCLQERYGPNFRIAPNSVLFNTPTGLKAIYANKANVAKAEYYKVYPRNVHMQTIWTCIDKTAHARKRRVLNNAFSDKALRFEEPLLHQNIDRWCELLDQQIGGRQWSQSLNMADWATYLIFDILGDLCFGKCFNMKEPNSNLRGIPDLMVSFVEIMHPIAFSPFAGVWTWLKPRGLDRIFAAATPRSAKDWANFVKECFQERVRVEEELRTNPKPEASVRKDFFSYIFQASNDEKGVRYSWDELLGESESLIIAGSDTTAIAIAAALFYLVHNPDVQATLVEEIHSTFSHFHEIGGNSKLHGCKYLRAFIHEVLRMSPPVAADLSREVSEGGIVIDDQFIPQGIRVASAAYCLHHNEDFFPEPFRFRPERWIVDDNDKTGSSAARVAIAESCFCAFSVGPRGCIGKNLAYLEMCLVLAKILYRFEVRKDLSSNKGGGSPDAREGRRVVNQYQLYDIFVAARDGPMVQFKRRVYI